jgi:hypothetical protein
MKPCPKIYLYLTIMVKIVAYPCHDHFYATDLIIPSLDELTLVVKVIRVNLPKLAMIPR